MPNLTNKAFDQLLQDAAAMPFSGWNFSALQGRWRENAPSWDYRQMVLERLPGISSLLDMGTGGGEFLAGLAKDSKLPPQTWATEAYPPNVPVARACLEPLGVHVAQHPSDDALPFADAQFDLVINRHESYNVQEIKRILKPGGTFLTQQVGADDCIRLNELLQENAHLEYAFWTLDYARRELENIGMQVTLAQEEFTATWFKDIGAVVYYLKIIPWQIPNFNIEASREKLYTIYQLMQAEGGLHLTSHRFLLSALKPE